MFKEIEFDGIKVGLLANAATPFRFNQVFHEDLVKFFIGVETGKAEDGGLMIPRLAYIMHLQAEKKGFEKINEETFFEWLEQFSANGIMLHTNEIIQLYYANMVSGAKAKKKENQPIVK